MIIKENAQLVQFPALAMVKINLIVNVTEWERWKAQESLNNDINWSITLKYIYNNIYTIFK